MYKPFYNLRVRFAQCEMSQNEVARAAGMASSTMTARMTGAQPFDAWQIEKIAAALGISPEEYGKYFFDHKGPFDDEKEKGPTWWKMFEFQRPVIESVSDADAGKGLKAAFQYFSGEDVDELTLTQGAFSVFSVIRPYIDESKQAYEEAVSYGRNGANTRWEKKNG